MSESVVIRVFEVVGGSLCVAAEDGEAVYEQIAKALERGVSIDLSFRNVENLTSAFLNAAIGQLYGKFPAEVIKAHLSVSDMEQEDMFLLRRVVETAKSYFADPAPFQDARRSTMGEEDEPAD